MRYLLALMLAASLVLGGCTQPEPAPKPDNTDKTEVVTPGRMPPPIKYDEK